MTLRQSPSKLRGTPARKPPAGCPSYDYDEGGIRLRCSCGVHGLFILPSWKAIRLAELLKLGMLHGKAKADAEDLPARSA